MFAMLAKFALSALVNRSIEAAEDIVVDVITDTRGLAVKAVEKKVQDTDNKFDDILLAGIQKAAENKDYGLQRKATGPRANRRAKTK